MSTERLRRFERLIDSLREHGWAVKMEERPFTFFATRGTEHWFETPYYLYVSANRSLFAKLSSPKNSARRKIERRLRTWREVFSAARVYGR